MSENWLILGGEIAEFYGKNILGGKGGVYCGLATHSIFLEDDIDLRVEVWGRES